ncbi:MAG: cytochrome c-type biogenesis protein CcmH [Candidatus Poribacteria bacterium]|nr:cytochrome c-type biogenesis protein CcmH [Candidatus Poribacteria bacterium]
MTSLQLLRIALVFGLSFGANTLLVSANETNDGGGASIGAQLEQLKTSVYCYCGCTRETIQQCVCGTARQIEDDFRNSLIAGSSVEQIRNNYITKYGTQFSALMPPTGFNLVAYIMPVIIIILIGAVIFLVIRSKTRPSMIAQPEPREKSAVVSDDVQKQIEAELDSLKRER